jgi:hypothetical protein
LTNNRHYKLGRGTKIVVIMDIHILFVKPRSVKISFGGCSGVMLI